MYVKPKPMAWAALSWPVFTAAFVGAAAAWASRGSSAAVEFKNSLLRWGLATLDHGDGWFTFGEGTQVHLTWSALLAWILLAAVPAIAVYAVLATRKSQVEVDMQAAMNQNVAPPAPQTQPRQGAMMQQQPMGYPMGYPGAVPQGSAGVPPSMLPNNPGPQ